MGKALQDILSDPCTFFREVTGFVAEEWQSLILRMDLKNAVRLCCLLPRRAGKSLVLAIKILYECLITDEVEFRVLLLAPSKKQAGFVYKEIRKALRRSPALVHLRKTWQSRVGRKLLDSREETEIPTRGGKGVSVVSCASGDLTREGGKFIVGDRADILLVDETSLITDDTYELVKECTRTGQYRSIILIGTPRKTAGIFYEACRPVNDEWEYNADYLSATGWQVIHRDWTRISHLNEPHIKREIEQDIATASSQEVIETEKMAHFVAGYGRFFPPADIAAAIDTEIKHWSHYRDEKIIAAIDLTNLGQVSEDEIVLMYAAADGHHSFTVIHAETFVRHSNDERVNKARNLKDVVAKMAELRSGGLRPLKVYADTSNQISFQDLLEDAGFSVHPVQWSGKEKNDLMFNLQDCLGARLIRIPASTTYHGNKLLRQLRAYSFDISETGHIIFNRRQDIKKRAKKFNDDYVSALAMLAKWLTAFTPIKPSARVGKGKEVTWGSLDFSKTEKRAIAALN